MAAPEFYLVCRHPEGGYTAVAAYDLDGHLPEPVASDWRFPTANSAMEWAAEQESTAGVRLSEELTDAIDIEEASNLGAGWDEVESVTGDAFGEYANQALDAFARQPEDTHGLGMLLGAWDDAMDAQENDTPTNGPIILEAGDIPPWAGHVADAAQLVADDNAALLRDAAVRIRIRAQQLAEDSTDDFTRGMRRAAAILDQDANREERGGSPAVFAEHLPSGPHANAHMDWARTEASRLSERRDDLDSQALRVLEVAEALINLIDDANAAG